MGKPVFCRETMDLMVGDLRKAEAQASRWEAIADKLAGAVDFMVAEAWKSGPKAIPNADEALAEYKAMKEGK